MGPEPAAVGNLSSQLAGMSKCSGGGSVEGILWCWAPLQFWGCPPVIKLELEANSRTSAQTPPHQGPKLNLAEG